MVFVVTIALEVWYYLISAIFRIRRIPLWVKFHRVERDIFYSGIGSTPDFLGWVSQNMISIPVHSGLRKCWNAVTNGEKWPNAEECGSGTMLPGTLMRHLYLGQRHFGCLFGLRSIQLASLQALSLVPFQLPLMSSGHRITRLGFLAPRFWSFYERHLDFRWIFSTKN